MFPSLYHTHHSLHLEDLPFWLELASRQLGPVLELGCGTGRVLVPLAQAGYSVYGLDNDFEMLRFLRSRLPAGLQSDIYIFQGDFTHLHLARQFGLVILPCNTFSTLTPENRLSTLECVHRQLKPNGLFAVSLPNPFLLRHLPAHGEPEIEESFAYPLSDDPVQVSSAWQRTQQHFIIDWHYDVLFTDGKVQRFSMQARHYLTSAQSYLDEMRAVGFTSLITYGDFDRSRYSEEASELIILAS